MSLGLSLYLDVFRFGMAMLVWLDHSTFHGFTGHPYRFWFTATYGATAVNAFFVLSGFVIAHVTKSRETTGRSYAFARVARLYSVVVPALILTCLCDQAGTWRFPNYAGDWPGQLPDHQPARYLLTLAMLQETWVFGKMSPGTNGPFWSITYEAAYYVCYGLFLFRARRDAVIGGIIVFVVTGPRVACMFPLWIVGVVVYRWMLHHTVTFWLAAPLFPLSLAGLAFAGSFRFDPQLGEAALYSIDYVEAACVAVNIATAASALRGIRRVPHWAHAIIRWFGACSFAIYLCHEPLLWCLSAYRISPPGTNIQMAFLFIASFAVIAGVTWVGDVLRTRIRLTLYRCFPDPAGNPAV